MPRGTWISGWVHRSGLARSAAVFAGSVGDGALVPRARAEPTGKSGSPRSHLWAEAEGIRAEKGEACVVNTRSHIEKGPVMRRLRLLLLSILLAVPIVGTTGAPANACTSQLEPDGCEVINRVCERLMGGRCLG